MPRPEEGFSRLPPICRGCHSGCSQVVETRLVGWGRGLWITKLFPNFSIPVDSWTMTSLMPLTASLEKRSESCPVQSPCKGEPGGLALWPASSREKEGDVLLRDSGSQRTLAHQREEERQHPPTPISEPSAPSQAPLTPLTVSASFSLLLVIPGALFQLAAGRKAPGSQIAHKSINLSQSKHKEPQGHSWKGKEKALWSAVCSFTGKLHCCPHPFGKFCLA